MPILTSDFDYDLPAELIAQVPLEKRDASRLLAYKRSTKTIEHQVFSDVVDHLSPKDVLVVNETKVIPARLIGSREDTGGAMEFLLLKRLPDDSWESLVKPGKRAKPGIVFSFGDGRLKARVLGDAPGGARRVEFIYDGIFEEVLEALGQMPLPPYITTALQDKQRYQTVYARQSGSAAAPTAGLHFTDALLEQIRQKGVDVVPVLLHVGLGTFRPVKDEDASQHEMHEEHYAVSDDSAERINRARQNGGRIVCVGTTCVRTLESAANEDGIVMPGSGDTRIFITPGYRFKAVDALITNFHLPKSTLLMLVSALMGRDEALRAYHEAVAQRYRFFSFGDAMLIE